LKTSQGYIRILQHFATKLWNITNFVMLFHATMEFCLDLLRSKFWLIGEWSIGMKFYLKKDVVLYCQQFGHHCKYYAVTFDISVINLIPSFFLLARYIRPIRRRSSKWSHVQINYIKHFGSQWMLLISNMCTVICVTVLHCMQIKSYYLWKDFFGKTIFVMTLLHNRHWYFHV
jgi:hypothetical protein